MDHSRQKGSFILLCITLMVTWLPFVDNEYPEIPHHEHIPDQEGIDIEALRVQVENWAWRFGRHLYELSRKITYVDEISLRYAAAKVERVDGASLLNEMVSDIEKLVAWKIQAVQRIAETSEQAVTGHEYDENLQYDFFKAKSLDEKKLPLTPSKRFDNIKINLNHSTVHVATNVYDENAEVLNAIKCSELLDPTFMGNHDHDPKLLWQYFGSSKGFLRHYPGLKWPAEPTKEKDAADTYDCRMRPWYIEAAASPKDIVVLLDVSGSMTGLRYAIAKHVVINIMDTLTHNDFISVYKFSHTIDNVVPCFGNRLVPAHKENLEIIKDKINGIVPGNMSDFGLALTLAFDLLLNMSETRQGSLCNQAIMLISDGAPSTFEEIFIKFNQPPHVRIFTYLIGREVTEYTEMRWMACTHKGYYTHVTTMAEVREQVEKYIPVMARPLALEQTHSYIWTPVYADIADPKVSRWLFENRERRKRKQRLLRKMHLFQLYGDEIFQADDSELQARSQEDGDVELWSEDDFNAHENKKEIYESMEQYQLMTTVSVPVFNQCNVITTERILINGTWTEHVQESKKAELLGVAGTDVPIKQILSLAPAYKIGVNGYPFIITNNGHLVTHPDLRPLYNGLLKVGYSSVDIADVELGDLPIPPWERSPEILSLRKQMIDRKTNSTSAKVRIHYDNMKRVLNRINNYYFAPIKSTPFTLGLVLPHTYGNFRVLASTDIKAASFDLVTVFEGQKWRVHPEWVYCEHLYAANHPERSPEENLLYFLKYIQGHKREFNKEKMQRVKDPLPWEDNSSNDPKDDTKAKSDSYYCDRELLYNLIFDASATNVFGKKHSMATDVHNNDAGFARKNGVTITFVATRSGLTRWEDLLPEEELGNMTESHFINMNSRAIDEVWYKRAVEQHLVNNTTFVFSVPFEAHRKNDTYVTGSHAIFVQTEEGMAPAAVVGLQFKHSVFADTFLNVTSDCNSRHPCNMNCSSDELDCYLLDDSGFVIVSERSKDTGRFFGEVDGLIMQSLIVDGIYQGVNMYDYQAACVEERDDKNDASFILTPLRYVTNSLTWLLKRVTLLWIQYNLYSWWDLSWLSAWASNVEDSNEFHRYMDEAESTHHIIKPCSMNFTLYRLNMSQQKMKPLKAKLVKCNLSGCDRPFSVQQVPYTNLVLLAVDANCQCESSTATSINPTKITPLPNMTECDMLNINRYRGYPANKCLKSHPDEAKITDCGRGCNLKCETMLLIFCILLVSIQHVKLQQPQQLRRI